MVSRPTRKSKQCAAFAWGTYNSEKQRRKIRNNHARFGFVQGFHKLFVPGPLRTECARAKNVEYVCYLSSRKIARTHIAQSSVRFGPGRTGRYSRSVFQSNTRAETGHYQAGNPPGQALSHGFIFGADSFPIHLCQQRAMVLSIVQSGEHECTMLWHRKLAIFIDFAPPRGSIVHPIH